MARIEPKPTVDLVDIYDRQSAGFALYRLPSRLATAASVVCEQLRWDTRRNVDGLDLDQVEEDIAALIHGLGHPVACIDCPFDPDDPESIENWILESEDIMITINNCNCCGGGTGSGAGSTIIIPDGATIPDDYTPTIGGSTTPPANSGDPAYLPAKCDALHWLLYATRLAMLQWLDNVNSLASFSSWWGTITAPAQGPLYSPIGTAEYLQLLAMAQGYTAPSDQLTTAYDAAYNAMLCQLYQAETANDGAGAFVTMLNGVLSSFPAGVRGPLLYIASLMPMDDIYDDPAGLSIPATHQGRDCSNCGAPPVPSGLTLYDYTGTLGRLYVWNGTEFVQDSLDFKFNKVYWVRGDTAGHQDAAVKATGGSLITDRVRFLVHNPNVSPFDVHTVDSGAVTVGIGQTVEIVTRYLDVNNYGAGSHYMEITALELVPA